MREFVEGVRIKHRVGENSIKMYDKQGSVLRIETTINNPRPFRACREMIREGQPRLAWLPMRKGLADIARRVEISRAANQRHLEALAVVGEPAPTREVLDPLSQRVRKEGRPYRPLRPIAPEDNDLFGAVHARGTPARRVPEPRHTRGDRTGGETRIESRAGPSSVGSPVTWDCSGAWLDPKGAEDTDAIGSPPRDITR